MPRRHGYRLQLTAMTRYVHARLQAGMSVRNPGFADREELADLMLDSYEGTIDHHSETIIEARREIEDWFGGVGGKALLDCSWVCEKEEGGIAAACLSGWWDMRDCPLIYFVMTRRALKGSGLGSTVLQLALDSLAERGFSEVRAFVTEGNVPSEILCERFGFERIGGS